MIMKLGIRKFMCFGFYTVWWLLVTWIAFQEMLYVLEFSVTLKISWILGFLQNQCCICWISLLYHILIVNVWNSFSTESYWMEQRSKGLMSSQSEGITSFTIWLNLGYICIRSYSSLLIYYFPDLDQSFLLVL